MILEENKEFCSSITTLDMRFTRISKKGNILSPSDPIDLNSREAKLIMERFKFCVIKPPNDQVVKLHELLINLIVANPQSVVEIYIEADKKDESNSVRIKNQIDSPFNSSLIQRGSISLIQGEEDENSQIRNTLEVRI